jgi:hypothetical protein
MASPRKLVAGTFFIIPLEDGSFAYGRVLDYPFFALYNYRTDQPSGNLDDIASKPILFRQSVRMFDYTRWANIGHRELEGEAAEPSIFFMQSIENYRNCTIFDSAGMERSATPEECVGLERASVWDPPLIETRLLDTFEGRPNEAEIRARVRFDDTL